MDATAKQQQTHPKVSEKKWATGQSCVGKRSTTVKLGNKEWFDKELIGIKESFSATNLPFTS